MRTLQKGTNEWTCMEAGGVPMCLVASNVRISARYDGMMALNEGQIDPRAFGGQNPGPRQRVGAFIGYGSYGRASRLTRTFRLDDIPQADNADDITPGSSPRIRVPAFARQVTVTAYNPAGFSLRLFGSSENFALDEIWFEDGIQVATVPLPGDCVSLILDNYNINGNLVTPALTFDLAL